jgi:hypothetical protein
VICPPTLDLLFDSFALGELFIKHAARQPRQLRITCEPQRRGFKSAGSNRSHRSRSSRRITRSCTFRTINRAVNMNTTKASAITIDSNAPNEYSAALHRKIDHTKLIMNTGSTKK